MGNEGNQEAASGMMQELELVALAAGSYQATIAGIEMRPLTPARLLMLELMDSAFVREKPSGKINFWEELILALYLLSCPPDRFNSVLVHVCRKRAFVDALGIIKAGEDPKTGAMFELYADADAAFLATLAEFAATVDLSDLDAAQSEIIDFIAKSSLAYKLMAKKKMSQWAKPHGTTFSASTSIFAQSVRFRCSRFYGMFRLTK